MTLLWQMSNIVYIGYTFVCPKTATESTVSHTCVIDTYTYKVIIHLLDSHKMLHKYVAYTNTIMHRFLQMEHTTFL